MESFLLTGGGAFVLAFVLAFAVATTNGRLGLVLAIGVALGVAFVVAAYLGARADPPENCSDCSDFLGALWEPALVIHALRHQPDRVDPRRDDRQLRAASSRGSR